MAKCYHLDERRTNVLDATERLPPTSKLVVVIRIEPLTLSDTTLADNLDLSEMEALCAGEERGQPRTTLG
jgi:hypothetical protein